MTDKYRQAILIEAGDKNTVEQFINTMNKRVDRGQREFGVEIDIRRIDAERIDVERIETTDVESGGFSRATDTDET